MATKVEHQQLAADKSRVHHVWWECSECGYKMLSSNDVYCSQCGVKFEKKRG